jgi:hypothetical protein
VRTIRTECLDHLIVFSRRHLQAVVADYLSHYNQASPHRGLKLAQPLPQPVIPATNGKIIRHDVLGGSSSNTTSRPKPAPLTPTKQQPAVPSDAEDIAVHRQLPSSTPTTQTTFTLPSVVHQQSGLDNNPHQFLDPSKVERRRTRSRCHRRASQAERKTTLATNRQRSIQPGHDRRVPAPQPRPSNLPTEHRDLGPEYDDLERQLVGITPPHAEHLKQTNEHLIQERQGHHPFSRSRRHHQKPW